MLEAMPFMAIDRGYKQYLMKEIIKRAMEPGPYFSCLPKVMNNRAFKKGNTKIGNKPSK